MKEIGIYQNRAVFWLSYSDLLDGITPKSDWVCLAISNDEKPNSENLEYFIRQSIENGILEFKGHGLFGEYLHDWFDEIMVAIEVIENRPSIEITTTWHTDNALADSFWQCLFTTSLPKPTSLNTLKVICTDLDGVNREKELKAYLDKFKDGWLP